MNKITIITLFFSFLQQGIITANSDENNPKDTTVAQYHEKLALKSINTNQDSARIHFRIAGKIYSDLGDKSKLANLDKLLGISYAMQGNIDSAVFYMEKSLEYFKSINDSLRIAFSYNNIGLMYTNNGRYKKGMEYLILSLKIKRKLQNQYEDRILKIGTTQINIGISFHYLQNFNKAKEYYYKARETCEAENDSNSLFKIDIQIASLYYDMKSYDKAQVLYEKLLKSEKKNKNVYLRAKIHNNYGSVLIANKEYNKAEIILKKAYELNKSLNNYSSMVKNLNNLAEIYVEAKDYKKALTIVEKSYKISKENDYLVSEKHATEVLADLYSRTKDFKNAYKYLKNANVIADTLFGIEKNKITLELETKYKTKEQKQAIALQKLKIEKITLFWVVSLIVMLLILVLTFILIRLNTQKAKINQLLEHKNEELKTLIATKDKFFALISHDLKNPLSAFGAIAEQLDQYFDDINPQEIHEYINELNVSAKQINSLLLNLLHWAAIQNNRIKFQAAQVNLSELVDNNISLLKNNADMKNLSIKNNVPENCIALSDLELMNIVVRNLLSNAIKYTDEGGFITIDAEKNADNIQLSIADTGIGIDAEDIPKLFRIDVDTKTIGNSVEKGTGLGLILVKEMLDKCNSTIKVESEKGKGSKFIINLPKGSINNE